MINTQLANLKTITVLFLGLLSIGIVNDTRATEPNNVLIVLDLSLSMEEKFGNTTRIESARTVFSKILTQIPSSTALALRAFAHKGSRRTLQACAETELVIPFGGDNRNAVIRAVNNLQPVGRKTPLAFALSRAAGDLAKLSGKNKIILVSDGIENCDGKPEQIAEQIFDSGIMVDTIAIGPEAAAQLGRIALAGGGQFFLGNSSEALSEALSLSTGGQKMRPLPAADGSPPGPQTPNPCVHLTENTDPSTSDQDTTSDDATKTSGAVYENEISPVVHLEIIFDSSGSMNAKLEGRTRMDVARQVLAETAQSLDLDSIAVAFRAYGFNNTAQVEDTKEISCRNTELLVEFGVRNSKTIVNRSQELRAIGYTPIAESLRLAGIDLEPYNSTHPTILLISDGKETCDGNPVEEVLQLQARGINVRVHVIGLNLDNTVRKQLEAVAHAGHGDYFDASDYSSLVNSLKQVVQSVHKTVAEVRPTPTIQVVECEPVAEPDPPLPPEPEPKVEEERLDDYEPGRLINPVSGGDDLDTAVTLTPGQYTFEEHLPAKKKTWFFVPTQIGQRGIINITSQSGRLLTKDDGSVIEATSGERNKFGFVNAFRVWIYQINGKRLRSAWVNSTNHSSFTHFIDLSGEGFYFSIEGGNKSVQKDALFEVLIEDAGDYQAGFEASAKDPSKAVSIPIGEPITGYIGLRDRADMYRLKGIPPGTTQLNLDVTFPDYEWRFLIEVFDAAKAPRGRLKKFTHLAGDATLVFPLKSDVSEYIIRITDGVPYLNHRFSDYMLEVNTD